MRWQVPQSSELNLRTVATVLPLVVVSVAYHSAEPLAKLAADLARQQLPPQRWLVVDNSPLSAPLAAEALQRILGPVPLQLLLGEQGQGFGVGCNRAFDWLAAAGFKDWVWLLNPDTSLRRGDECLQLISSLATLQPTTLAGTAVLDEQRQLEASGGWIDPGLNFRRRRIGAAQAEQQTPLAVDWLSGCSLVLQPTAHRPQARFDPHLPLYYEDMDLCLRLASSASGAVEVLWLPQPQLGHQRGAGSHTPASRRLELSSISYLRFLRRHMPLWVRLLRRLRLLLRALLLLPLQPRRSGAVLRAFVRA